MASCSVPAPSRPCSRERVTLRSIERSMVLSDDYWFMVAYIMRVHGQTHELVKHLPLAMLQTSNKHPRMRLKMIKNATSTAGEIQPPFVSTDDASRTTFFTFSQQPYDRCTQFAFRLFVWVDAATDRARLILFADHYLSDGASLNVVLHDILDFAALASRGTPAPPIELPLSPSLYDALLHGHAFAAPALQLLMRRGARTLLKLSPAFHTLLAPNALQEDFHLDHPPKNPSLLLFASGTRDNLDRIVAKCRAEHTTFFGAFAAAVFLSFIVATDALDNRAFKLTLAVNFNMRDRVTTPIAHDAVGCFITGSEMPTPTVDAPQQRFWDLARALKQRSVATAASFPAMALPLILMDEHLTRDGDPSVIDAFPLDASTLADADISSLGKYPFPHAHAFASGDLTIETLHYSGHVPFFGAACYFCATSLDCVSYSLSHRVDERTGNALFTTTVAAMEACWRVESHETLPQVAAKLRLVR